MSNKRYTIGLDIGTNSVGWAVLDENLQLASGKKHINDNGKQRRSRTNLWGVRLFDAAETAENRRLKRGMRRRIARRKERLNYLRGIFQSEILKFDDSFFIRMDESFLQSDDKKATEFDYRDQNGMMQTKKVESIATIKYPLFNGQVGMGETYADEKAYYDAYPTIYHLRKRLISDSSQADLRLVYLAMHHIFKYRGHFVNQGEVFDLKNVDIAANLAEAWRLFDEASEFKFRFDEIDGQAANSILKNKKISASQRAYELNELYQVTDDILQLDENAKFSEEYESLSTASKKTKWLAEKQKQIKAFLTAIVGNALSPKQIFANDEYDVKQEQDFPDKIKFSNENFDEQLDELSVFLTANEIDAIKAAKKVYEALVLSQILTKDSLAASMVDKYDEHKSQLKALKQFAKRQSVALYNALFNEYTDAKGKPQVGVYQQYIEGVGNPSKKLSREDFYVALKKTLEAHITGLQFPKSDEKMVFTDTALSDSDQQFLDDINQYMGLEQYLPKQRQADNGAIPYQVHEYELRQIIEQQGRYYPFLLEKMDEEYRLIKLFNFRIPYYVGTLATHDKNAKNTWVVRKNDTKVTPWNFDQVIDKESSAVQFIERMTNFDTYVPAEKVLPQASLLYQEFIINNELISSGYYLNGKKEFFSPEQRQKIINRLFKKYRKVTATKMREFLANEFEIVLADNRELFGLDTFVNAPSYNGSFSTFLDLQKAGIDESMIVDNPEIFEEIIKWQTIFEDRKVLKKTMIDANDAQWHHLLTDDQIKALSKRHYTGWGRLSKKLLAGIKTSTGQTIIERLREGSYSNFMRLLEDEKISAYIANAQGSSANKDNLTYDLVDQLAGSPAIKKGIWQSLKIIQELERYLGRENIEKVVIEMSRDDQSSRRTKTRKSQIENFYKTFKEKTGNAILKELKDQLAVQDEKSLSNEKVFLYFMQNGRSMYSNEALDLQRLSEYQVDHIVPQTYIKDDSLDNKVLVTVQDNQNKGGDTPGKNVIYRMTPIWEELAKNGQISPRKLANLKKGPITDKQREGFINRQLVENRQITKHVANILTNYFEDTDTVILTPKSGLTSQFRSGKVYLLDNGKFIEKQIHSGFVKNRDLNHYHHAHDAYLNAFVAQFIYQTNPELRNSWVYGKYETTDPNGLGKWATQRKHKSLQLLSDMVNEEWEFIDPDTGEIRTFNRDVMLSQVAKTLQYRNINIVKKTEVQTGKFGDESVYKKDSKAKNFSSGLKNQYPAQKYGGTKAGISAVTVITRDNKGITPVSVTALEYDKYLAASDKLAWLKNNYPKISEIVIEQLPKYTKYQLSAGGVRLLASYQEAQSGSELPMLDLTALNDESVDRVGLKNLYDQLTVYIQNNRLFTDAKAKLLATSMKENFSKLDDLTEMKKVIIQLLGVTVGKNQNLNALQGIGLGTTAQRLKSGNTISAETTIIYESVTGLYQTRKTII